MIHPLSWVPRAPRFGTEPKKTAEVLQAGTNLLIGPATTPPHQGLTVWSATLSPKFLNKTTQKTTISQLLEGVKDNIPLYFGRSSSANSMATLNYLSPDFKEKVLKGNNDVIYLTNTLQHLVGMDKITNYVSRVHGCFYNSNGNMYYLDGVPGQDADSPELNTTLQDGTPHRAALNGSYIKRQGQAWETIPRHTPIQLKAGDTLGLPGPNAYTPLEILV